MCSDENECEDEFVCQDDEYCINTDGSYKCVGKYFMEFYQNFYAYFRSFASAVL